MWTWLPSCVIATVRWLRDGLRYPVARRVSGAGVDRRLPLLGLTTSAIVTVLRMGFDSSDALLRGRVRAGRNGIAALRSWRGFDVRCDCPEWTVGLRYP